MGHLTVLDAFAALLATAAMVAAAHPDIATDIIRFVGTAIGTFTGVFLYGLWRERRRRGLRSR